MIYIIGILPADVRGEALSEDAARTLAQGEIVHTDLKNADKYSVLKGKRLVFDAPNEGDALYCVSGDGFNEYVRLSESCVDCTLFPPQNPHYDDFTALSLKRLESGEEFCFDPELPLVISGIYNASDAARAKARLLDSAGDAPAFCAGELTCVSHIDGARHYDGTITLPPAPLKSRRRFGMTDLYRILLRLRAENGCPWDRVQTHESLRKNAVEEAFELVEAIDNNDVPNMCEESGDVILQGAFHCVIGEDKGEFTMRDCLSMLCRKLIDRHTHIFGDVVASDADEALKAWDAAKSKEKRYDSASSKMDGIARALPSLMRAYKVGKIASKSGIDFVDVDEAEKKLLEELGEVRDASEIGLEDECGDLLLSAVNVIRLRGVDPEIALLGATEKFVKRFKYIESRVKDIPSADRKTLDALWQEAKATEKKS